VSSDSGFDYVVVGAGAAGCVIANRLSANASCRVALVEAGPSDRTFANSIKTRIPVGNILLLPHARYNWQYEYLGGPGVGDRVLPCPRGKLLGGCTSVNGTVYIRGNARDYDDWERAGNEGWGWKDVLPAFLRHEDWRGEPSPYHARGGELTVERPRSFNPLSEALVEAAQDLGHRRNPDFNGDDQSGFERYFLNQRDGVRWSSSRAFLDPVMHRPNLFVFSGTTVERIQIENGRAVGVHVRTGTESRLLRAEVETIVAAGAIGTPHLLMLSGIGPADHLREHGIDVVCDLPGVGRNLQDHPTVFASRRNPSGESYAVSARSMGKILRSPLAYLWNRTGMLASNAAEAGGFIRTRPDLERCDVQMTFLVGLKENARTLPRAHGFLLLVQLLRPVGRGHVTLRSARPDEKPVLHAGFLQDRQDVDTLVRGLAEARRILAAPALSKFAGPEIEPGAQVSTDADLEAFVRRQVGTAYHPVGTCKMGPESDKEAVVDLRLSVRGVCGLRIADASVMPTIVGGNTAAPSMMIGERAAAFLLDAQAPSGRHVTRDPGSYSIQETA
jgi:choline dehydrogenase-like flavoprotein